MHFDTLVLSGNSTNAIATLGALQRLYEIEYVSKAHLETYVGTSSGSLISTLLAIDYDPIDILSIICVNKSYSKVSRLNLANLGYNGLIDFEPIESEMEHFVTSKIGYVPTLAQVKERFGKKLVYVTYNMTDGEKQYISCDTHPNLPIIKAARMSSTFPFVFSPYEYEGKYYVDGGVVDNFAMNYAQTIGTKCLGMFNVNPTRPYTPETNHFALIMHLFCVFITSSAENATIKQDSQSKIIKLTYEPSFFNFNSGNAELLSLFDVGYEECRAATIDLSADKTTA
jgi:NTE family protein